MVLSALDKLINRKLLCYYADEITGSVAKPVQSIIKEISAEKLLVITQDIILSKKQEGVTVCKLIEGGGLDRFAEIAPKSYGFDKGKVKRTEGVNLTKKLIRTAQVAILVMLLGTLIVGGTLAYLTASKDKINTITVGKVEVVIEEPGVNNNSVEWGINSKPVYLTATNDSIDGVVRAMIIPEFLNENGEYINCPGAAQNAPVSNKIVMGDITFVALDNYAIQNGYALDFS